MRTFFLVIVVSIAFAGYTQNLSSGYWLPLKSLEQIDKSRLDICDTVSEYPFKGIGFVSNKEASLWGWDEPDPNIYRMTPLKEKGSWLVKRYSHYTFYPEIGKVILRVSNDTLYMQLSTNTAHFFQTFVRKYGGIDLDGYWSGGIGNLLIKGRYIMKNEFDTIEFKKNGAIALHKAKGQILNLWTFNSFKFITYGSRCQGNSARMAIELYNGKVKKQYLIKMSSGDSIDFYPIIKWENRWTPVTDNLAFSMLRAVPVVPKKIYDQWQLNDSYSPLSYDTSF